MGQYYDPETDLFENWHRFYDPTTGRYLEPDPIWRYPEVLLPRLASGHFDPVYAYAGDNPISATDPTGEADTSAPDSLVKQWEAAMESGGGAAWAYLASKAGEAVDAVGRGVVSGAGKASMVASLLLPNNSIADGATEAAMLAADRTAMAAQSSDKGKDKDESDDQVVEPTPDSHPDDFRHVRGRPGRENTRTGEVWEKDRLHGDHWEVYRNRKDYEKGRRLRDVWEDGRPKRTFR